MKCFAVLLIIISSLGLTIPQTFGVYVEFDGNDYRLFLNNKHVVDFQLNWTSEYYPNGKITFDESINDTILLQIPKNIPRNTNLDFGSSLYAIQTDGSWEEIKETDSNCFYILEIPVNDSDYIEIETVSVATGRWELVTIQNEDCDDVYDKSTFQNESVFPRHGYQPPHIMSPLKQFKSGVTVDEIKCKDTLLLIKKHDGTPSCVKPETKEKLEQRNWSYHKETLLVLDDNQQDIGRYLKQVSILDGNHIDATVSYPTNIAHHEMYPDEHQSIVSDCTEKNNDADLSLLYLKEIDDIQKQITFTQENKTFDGLKCDDALWQELTRWGYCGPPRPLLSHVETVMPSIADAHKRVGFVFDLPKYLPEGYDIQKITVGRDGDRITMYISPEPISSETYACDFTWHYEGIHLSYRTHPDILSFGSRYSNSTGEPQTWPVTINENPGKAEQRWVGDRFGMPIPQLSDLQMSMPDDGILVSMSSSLPVEELIKVAESISKPIFNADIVPHYSSSYNMQMQNNDDFIPVQITGDTAYQICNKIRMICEDDHTFDATYDLSAHTATFEQSVSYNRYVLEITPSDICYKINGDPKKYCSTLHVSYSPIVDGNKSVLLFKPLDYWKNVSEKELYKLDEKYGEIFYKELGKMMLKDEIKNELKRQNIENANDDFTLHVAGADESSQVFYKSVINGTDGKSYMFDGGAYYNQIRGLSFEELVFHDSILDELPLDSLFDDQPIIISPKDDENNQHNTITVNLEDGSDMLFYNGMSVPMKISVYSSEKAKDRPRPEWTSPILDPAQTMTFSLNGTGLYKWDARLEPEPSPNDWWPRYVGGTIAAYSNETQNLKLEEKLGIAQVFVQNSEIPYSGLSTKNDVLEIKFNSAIHEMLPDASEYYTARAYQLIPFNVQITIEESD
ncbi:MAG: hypothetical protein K5798_10885 [Nitrosopumilus sp.]|uniref:hypothetical protein n=1 Tax=Nitrosopumilus sp. TaxID=2024843 RepID=UPI00242C55ED|nr:hypothetical protein [Nitrosopumilus sp.]MCV0367750.1 hypothetical protein [Nitrosopumilus sp.]